jgi:hypothetical protein
MKYNVLVKRKTGEFYEHTGVDLCGVDKDFYVIDWYEPYQKRLHYIPDLEYINIKEDTTDDSQDIQ